MSEQRCGNCKHFDEGQEFGPAFCRWEENTIPPPVIRARLFGQRTPETTPESGAKCPAFAAK